MDGWMDVFFSGIFTSTDTHRLRLLEYIGRRTSGNCCAAAIAQHKVHKASDPCDCLNPFF